MTLTKYGHACFVLEKQGQKLIVDPGEWTEDLPDVSGTIALVITHEHADHFSPAHIDKIRALNPEVQIFAAVEATAKIDGAVNPKKGEPYQVGAFKLLFGGDLHAAVHPNLPRIHNLTLTVNDNIYYPGDSYDLPATTVQTVLLPLNAPWTGIAATIDFYAAVRAKLFIPTHDALLSDIGHSVYNVSQRVEKEAEYRYLKPGETIEV